MKKHLKETAILFLFFIALSLSFSNNFWRVGDQDKFLSMQKESEGWVIGKISHVLDTGFSSANLLLGLIEGRPLSSDNRLDQYAYFFGREPIQSYYRYNSQLGLQGDIYAGLAAFGSSIGMDRQQILQAEHQLSSVLLSLLLSFLVYWIYLQLGFWPALGGALSILSSAWLVYFARNLYWVLWIHFLPFVALLGTYQSQWNTKRSTRIVQLLIVAGTMFLKAGCGYEFLSTILLSTLIPVIYYGILNAQKWRTIFRQSLEVGMAGMTGVLLAFGAHFMVLIQQYSLSIAVKHISFIALDRTFFPQQSPTAPSRLILDLLSDASRWHPFNLAFLPNIGTLGQWLTVVAIASSIILSVVALNRKLSQNLCPPRQALALIAATLLSALCPLSWLLLAPAHFAMHFTFLYFLWYLPFMIISSVLVAYALRCCWLLSPAKLLQIPNGQTLGLLACAVLIFSYSWRQQPFHLPELNDFYIQLSEHINADITHIVIVGDKNLATRHTRPITTQLELPLTYLSNEDYIAGASPLSGASQQENKELVILYDRSKFQCATYHIPQFLSYENVDLCWGKSTEFSTILTPRSQEDFFQWFNLQLSGTEKKNIRDLIGLSYLFAEVSSNCTTSSSICNFIVRTFRNQWLVHLANQFPNHDFNQWIEQPLTVIWKNPNSPSIIYVLLEADALASLPTKIEGLGLIINGKSTVNFSGFDLLEKKRYYFGTVYIGDIMPTDSTIAQDLSLWDFSLRILSRNNLPILNVL